ncbi:hypothetical protein DLM_2230 [Aquitalea magnusonii]|uniref:DUF2235 domain-containing protein n=1 Tax=Aquitalea magnusonii TaxID=332411 RepID=A0A3G9GEF1_9NEIS|nr:DUF2235 domain-containing protein [Aquitalea magnusonii]BBF85845.1 hypothetical protein DLM_2230 [Aquitalea magnusonii]
MSESAINLEHAQLAAPWDEQLDAFPSDAQELRNTRYVQQQEMQEASLAAHAQRRPPPCGLVTNVSLFFDGTNNHRATDRLTNSHSNIARLYDASIQGERAARDGYFSYYLQGVGTQFKEIHEMSFSAAGLKYAAGGQMRILWGLTRLIDALRKSKSPDPDHPEDLPDDEAYRIACDMVNGELNHWDTRRQGPVPPSKRRHQAMRNGMASIIQHLEVQQAPKLAGLRVHVYGFSRGAAEARAFLHWLLELCEYGEDGKYRLFGVPVKVPFVGLFDTVASVGLAAIRPPALGHMDWADNTMPLPQAPGFIGQHVHLVSAHEQRICFPLDSTRLPSGRYPAGNLGEFVYPGVHSDVGGGYGLREQGRCGGEVGMQLSQIALRRMYLLAFRAAAPMTVPKELYDTSEGKLASIESWRWMDSEVQEQFKVSNDLITRFNAWAQLRDCAEDTVEKIVVKQTALITAWRIERFAGGLGGSGGVQQEQTAAFRRIPPDDAMHNDWAKTAWRQAQAHEQAQDELAAVINRPGSTMRDVQKAQDKVAANPAPPGVVDPRSGQVVPGLSVPSPAKDFDPSMDHSQLREAALEFREDYLHWRRVDGLFDAKGKRLPTPLAEPGQASLIDSDPDWKRPWHLTWTLIGLWLSTLFSRPINPDHEYEGVYLLREGEQRWRDVGNGQGLTAAANRDLLALFDEHIHDSRAWFMVAATGNRETDGSYFRLRTILYDDITNKRYLNALQKSAAACEPPDGAQAQPAELAGQQGGG